jgi:hypothetical protein
VEGQRREVRRVLRPRALADFVKQNHRKCCGRERIKSGGKHNWKIHIDPTTTLTLTLSSRTSCTVSS